MSISNYPYTLEERILMLNGIKWLNENFPLPEGYIWDSSWCESGPEFTALKFDMTVKAYKYITDIATVREPWVDTLIEKDKVKKFNSIIRWVGFDYFHH